jgi:hypothetical protein
VVDPSGRPPAAGTPDVEVAGVAAALVSLAGSAGGAVELTGTTGVPVVV